MNNRIVRTGLKSPNVPANPVDAHDVPSSFARQLLDALPDPTLLIGKTGLIAYANQACLAVFDWLAEELDGKSIADLIAPGDAKEVLAWLSGERMCSEIESQPITARLRDGRLLPADLSVSELPDAPGGTLLCVIRDMGDVVKARKELNESRERFALAMSGTHDGIWDWDVRTDQVFITERIRELFGMESNIGTAMDWLDCIHPFDQGPYINALKAHLKGETDFFSIDYRLKGDKELWVRHRGLGLRDQSGRVFRMAGSVGDVTESKQAEAKLKETLAQAEAANKAKSDFLAAMSHELRTPLNAIIGFSEMIHSRMLGPLGTEKYGEYAGDIMVSARHLLDIINDILEMARMDAGQAEFRPEPVDMAQVIDASLRLLHQRISHAGLSVTAKTFPELPKIMGDERRLKQVMINLLGNAIKFTPQGGSIVVEAKPVLSGRLMVRVIDSGIGIAERDIPRALAPFTQVDSVVARRYQGSGLGLPLAKAFVELHGGNLELSSILGKGTTVTLYFPFSRPGV
jgi:PAS domain S-box-containing protein